METVTADILFDRVLLDAVICTYMLVILMFVLYAGWRAH